MNVPARSAAAMSISPLTAVTSRPSRVNVTSSAGGAAGSAMGTAPLLDVHEELVAEHLDGRGDRRRDRRPQDADGRLLGRPAEPGRDVVGGVEQEVEILLAPLT